MAGDAPGWDAVYQDARPQDLPWFSPTIDADVEAALGRLAVAPAHGPLLDLGTGPGTFAIEMARRGFDVVAADISPSAIRMAQRRAGALSRKIEWVAADLFDCAWPNRFQLIHDRGAYHTLDAPGRVRYAGLVATWLRPGGHLILKTFHEDEPGDWGPNRIGRRELEANFGSILDIEEIAASTFPGMLEPHPLAWRSVFLSRASAAPRRARRSA